ncbi:MAG: multiprotein bridging factor aMBF1 [Candidatus Bathyarchaeia archaeon]
MLGAVGLQCDVCGREITGKPHRVIIEGAKMVTCEECSKLGSEYWEPKPVMRPLETSTRKLTKLSSSVKVVSTPVKRASSSTIDVSGKLEVVEGFGLIVKRARERMGLTPEDLGKKIGEKESVIKKVESERIVPDIRLASKLEHALKIKILRESTMLEDEKFSLGAKFNREITLGEIVQLKDSKRGKRGNEGDNSLS